MTYEYKFAIVSEEDGSAILDFDRFPEIVCEVSKADIKQNKVKAIAKDAVKNALQARVDYQDEIPETDSAGADEDSVVKLSPLDGLKLSLYKMYKESGLSRAEFAKRASVTPTGLTRALDLYHASRFDVLIDMFDQLGYSVSAQIDISRTA